jgi:NAD(P)-dependent dehydrogenase (short-subunit alcohol dehydrogenase family)
MDHDGAICPDIWFGDPLEQRHMTQTWLITGCSSGFGRELALAALRAGHHVAMTARNVRSLEPLVALAPDRAMAIELDVTEPVGPARAVADAQRRFDRIDVLVSNAGYGLVAALEETSESQLQRNLTTNFLGPLRLIRATMPLMRQLGSGRIICMGAAAAVMNHPGFSIYAGAKAGLDAACDAIAQEVAPFGIKVTTVIPGPFRTDFIARGLDKPEHPMPEYSGTSGKFAALLRTINGKQPGDPAKAAEAILQLAALESPPLRLFIGKYAFGLGKKKIEQLQGELAASEPIGLKTDF